MPSHKSAIKRVRQTKTRTIRNRKIISTLRTAIKNFLVVIGNKELETAEKNLPKVISIIDSAATKGVIHKNQSSRRISRLTHKVNSLRTSQPEAGA